MDQRRYNAPTANEIAAVLPGPGDERHGGRDIIVHLRGGGLQRISYGSPGYIPLHYTLLYPNGDLGWHWDMLLQGRGQAEDDGGELDENGRLTAHRYHAYHIHYREQHNGLLFLGGRLFQQYLVDVWAQIEQAHLEFIRYHQDDLRAEVYSGLADAVGQGESLQEIGRRLVLPSSHIGSPRQMQQLYQDSTAIC